MRGWRVVLAFGVIAALVALAVALRLDLAERVLLWRLEQIGASPAAVHVARLGAHGMALAELEIGAPEAPDLAIAELEISWSLDGMLAWQLDSVRVSGLRLRGTLGDAGLRFGAADAIWPGDDDGAAETHALPARDLEVRDARLALETPHGVATGELGGRLRAAPDGALDGAIELEVEHPLVRANGTVAVSGTLSELAGDVALALRDAREPARVVPATLRGHVAGGVSALRFDLALDAADGRLHAEAKGSADLTARSAHAELRLSPLDFSPGGLQPATLLPALEVLLTSSGVENWDGRIEARGTLELADGVPDLRLDLMLRELGFESQSVRVSGIVGAVAVRGPPFQTPRGQSISIARLDPGVPLTDGVLDFRIRPSRVLELHKATWKFAGGELRAEDLELELGGRRSEARLQARGIDLAALLALLAIDGLDGTGRIDGELPLVHSDGQIRVEAAVLRAAAPGGRIRYRPTESVAGFAASRPDDLGVAVAVLSDFHYEELEARFDGDLNGELELALHLRGENPGYRDGHPVELNLNLDAPVADLVRAGQRVYRVPRVIGERLRELTDEERR